jgi:chorismate synthase
MPLRFLTAGESHGPSLTAILEGIPAGLPLDEGMINQQLARRQQGYGKGARMALEKDHGRITGGVMAGATTGAPVSIIIENQDHGKWKGKSIDAFTTPRPGHADLSGAVKYGLPDIRPVLERASARETAARVAVGAVCRALLEQFGIILGGYVVSLGEVTADLGGMEYHERFRLAEESDVRCPDGSAGERMHALIRQTMENKDTLGGVVEVVALGVPAGLGSYTQWDKRLDSRLGAAVLSVHAIKGVEIGPAFENTRLPGSKVHDAIRLDGEKLVRPTNRSGGIEGGISNGMPVVIHAAMKPIPTTLAPQATVDLASGAETPTRYERSDYCPTPRAVPVIEAMMAFVIADALIEKIGGDSMDELVPRFLSLKKPRLNDLEMDGGSFLFWPEA